MTFNISDRSYMKVLVAIWVTILVLNPGKIEGYIFPVVTPMELDRVGRATDESAAIWGKSSRIRENCSYRFIRWYLGQRGNIDAPARVNTGKPILRPPGEFSFGPWFVNIPASQIEKNSYADVYHRCRYWGFQSPWLIESHFWN